MTAKVELLTPSGGKVILDPTDTAVDRTLTLPAVAGTVFNQGNVVGTVSESSGVPTGAIIERDSNSNGEFVKYADGTMICFRRQFTLNFFNQARLTTAFTYPAVFSSIPTSTISFDSSNTVESLGFSTKAGGALVLSAETTSSGNGRLYRQGTKNLASGDSVTVNFTLVGRWY